MGVVNISAVAGYKVTKTVSETRCSESSPHLPGDSLESSTIKLVPRKHGALRPQKPLRLIRDGEVGGGREFLYLTPTRYTITTRTTLHSGGQLCEPF